MMSPPPKLLLWVKVNTKAAQSKIIGWAKEEPLRLKIALNAVPEKGKANAALLSFLAKSLGLNKSAFTLIQGEFSPLKKIEIKGLSFAQLQAKIAHLLS